MIGSPFRSAACAWLIAAGACAGGSPASSGAAAAPAGGPAAPAPSGSAGTPASDPLAGQPLAGQLLAGQPPAGPQPVQRSPANLPPGACVTTGTIEASLRPANVLFAIDRSGSMSCNLPPLTESAACELAPARVDRAQPSKWEIVRDALKQALAALPSTASAGITYFNNDGQCGVQSRPHVAIAGLDPQQLASLGGSLDQVTPQGGTPLVGGLILAYKQLNPDQTPNQRYGNKFVVLLTDGQESCAPEATERLLNEELPKSRTAAITTFVIGVPGSERSRQFLSRLAFAGGTARAPACDHAGFDSATGDCHFDMTRDGDLAAGLSQALAAISGRALSCEFDVPQPRNGGVLDYDEVNVEVVDRPGDAARVVAQDATRPCDGGADGWQYSVDKRKILVCGAACEGVRRAASIRIALGCKSVTVL